MDTMMLRQRVIDRQLSSMDYQIKVRPRCGTLMTNFLDSAGEPLRSVIYRLSQEGLKDREIATRLNIARQRVRRLKDKVHNHRDEGRSFQGRLFCKKSNEEVQT
jgi:hypothetical protein